MTLRAAAIAAFVVLSAAGAATAQPAQVAEVRNLAPDATPAPATLADFKGLIGNWSGPMGSAGFSTTNDGVIVGHLELSGDPGKIRVMEIWILRPDGNSVQINQKHFDAALAAREDKDAWAHRKLLALDAQHVYLENLTWVTQGDTLTLLVRLNGGVVSTTVMKRTK